MKFDSKTITHIAQLAKLPLTDAENSRMQGEMSAIMTFVEKLNALDTTGVEPTSQVTGLVNVMREDADNYTFAKEDIVATMPDADEQGNLRVKSIFVDHKDAR